MHTSYTDILDISYEERMYLIEFINSKQDATSKAMKEATDKLKQKQYKK